MGARITSFEGLGVVVTGASSGIGAGLAIEMARRGARVALVARRESRLASVATQIRDGGHEAHIIVADVADRESATRAMSEAESLLGGVDVAVFNAGIGAHQTLIEHDLAHAETLLQVNLFGTLYCAHPIARAMAERGKGWLVFMASVAGLVPVPGESVYAASKFGMVGLAESISIELEPRGVHVLTVCPGAVNTEFVPPEERDRMPEAGRRMMIEPADVVTATLKALEKGKDRIIVPKKLEVAVAMRGLAPSVVRSGTARATRQVLPD
jgi:short-subunit dehydrogenase